MLEVKRSYHLQGHQGAIYALSGFKSDKHFISVGGDGIAVVWDLENPEQGKVLAKVDSQLFSVAYFESRALAVLGNMNGGIHFIDLNTGENPKNLLAHEKGVFGFMGYEKYFFSIGGKGMLIKWEMDTLESKESLVLSGKSLRCIASSGSRNELAIGSSDHSIYFVDPETMQIRHRIENAHEQSVFSLAYHPDGKHLISGGRDARFRVWNLEIMEELNQKPAHWYTINAIAFHPEGHIFATASRDKSIKIWDASSFELLKVLDLIRFGAHANSVNTLHWAAYKNMLISGSDDRSLAIWEFS